MEIHDEFKKNVTKVDMDGLLSGLLKLLSYPKTVHIIQEYGTIEKTKPGNSDIDSIVVGPGHIGSAIAQSPLECGCIQQSSTDSLVESGFKRQSSTESLVKSGVTRQRSTDSLVNFSVTGQSSTESLVKSDTSLTHSRENSMTTGLAAQHHGIVVEGTGAQKVISFHVGYAIEKKAAEFRKRMDSVILKAFSAKDTSQILQAEIQLYEEGFGISEQIQETFDPQMFTKQQEQEKCDAPRESLTEYAHRFLNGVLDICIAKAYAILEEAEYNTENMTAAVGDPSDDIFQDTRNIWKLNVTPEGGMFHNPRMGMQMLFPSDAVDETTTITVRIMDYFTDFPEEAVDWSVVTPRVKIEPDDIQYKTKVYLIINHSLQVELSKVKCKGSPVLLHSDNDEDVWKVVSSSSMNRDDIQLPINNDKRAILTSTSVIVAMETNCRFCLFYVKNDLGVRVPAMRVNVMVFADYQPQGQNLNIRVYAAHDLAHRRCDVERREIDNHGGHLIGTRTVVVLEEETPLTIKIVVNGEVQELRISYDMIRLELDQTSGDVPCADCVVTRNQRSDTAAAAASIPPPTTANITVTAWQNSMRPDPINKQVDLESLRVAVREVASNVQLHRGDCGEVGGALSGDGQVIGESAPFQTQLDAERNAVIFCLQENLKDDELDTIRRYLNIGRDQMQGLDDEEKRRIILDVFVGDMSAQQVIRRLQGLGILRDEMRRRLETFASN